MIDYSLAWPAPAKLNLMLRILGRRADGYHELQTVFQFIDFCDYLWFTVRQDGEIKRLNNISMIPAAEDLTVRAARALQKFTGCKYGVEIDYEKNLPLGGGLGGGSSDAATTLIALNHLWKTELNQQELIKIGLTLGADVPIFVQGQAAWAEGIGERLTPLELPKSWFLILMPSCTISTKAIFNHPQLTRTSNPITIGDFLAGARVNDCLSVVKQEYPPVAAALEWFDQWGEGRLTGTGACVFKEFAEHAAALEVYARKPPEINGVVAQGLNYSPLLDRCLKI